MSLKNILQEITKVLDELDRDREEILGISRQMIRDSSVAIKSIHRKEFSTYEKKIKEIRSNHDQLIQLVNKNQGVFDKYLKGPEQEYVEAMCLHAILKNQELPDPFKLKIDPINYLLGLSDVIGELRRYALDNIINSQIKDLNNILEIMDDIYTNLFSLDYPSGLTQDLRHKIDTARGIIERTRGDISISLQMDKLNKNLEKK